MPEALFWQTSEARPAGYVGRVGRVEGHLQSVNGV